MLSFDFGFQVILYDRLTIENQNTIRMLNTKLEFTFSD